MTEQDENKTATETQAAKEPAKEKPATPKPAHKPRAKHTGRGLLLVLLIVLAGAGAAGYYGVILFKQQAARLDALATQQVQLQNQNAQLKSHLSDRLQTLSKQQAELANAIEVLREKNQFVRKDWLVMEAEYLLQLANYRLLFERDINTAIVALDTADARLRDTGDPSLIAVRKAIADSIQALKAVPQADLAGLSLKLSAITQAIDSLPLNTPDPRSKAQEQQHVPGETRQVKSWSELPAAIWHDLKSLIIIRDHTQPVEPMIAPDQRFFLLENLRLQIEQARLAMLSGHAEVYKERIGTAIKWIETYFDKTAPQTQAMLTTLQELQASAIAPPLPDISKPYQLLEQYRQNANAAADKK